MKIKHASGNNMIREINILENNPFNDSMSFMEMKLDLWLTIQCNFDFSNYPMDTQSCQILFSSKGHNNINFRLYNQERVLPFSALGYTDNTTVHYYEQDSQEVWVKVRIRVQVRVRVRVRVLIYQ